MFFFLDHNRSCTEAYALKLRSGDEVSIPQEIDNNSPAENVKAGSVNGRYYSHCDPCNKSFIRPGDLKRHNNYCHGGQLVLRNDTLYPPEQQNSMVGHEEEVVTTTSNKEMFTTTTSSNEDMVTTSNTVSNF